MGCGGGMPPTLMTSTVIKARLWPGIFLAAVYGDNTLIDM
jgi:hypothetical protein